MKTQRLVQAFFYNNPDGYPPIINGSRMLSNAGFDVEIYCRDDGNKWDVAYPANVKVERIAPSSTSSAQNFWSFCRQSMRYANSNTTAFIGHDMHGLIPARLLALRHHRPLIYHCYDYSSSDYAQTRGSWLIKKLQTGFARSASIVTVPDEGLAATLSRDLGLKRAPMVMVNSPLKSHAAGGALRAALKERGRVFEKVVFRQGRIGRGHGLEVTIRSIPSWSSSKWGFVVMGIGEPDYLRSLSELAASLGVADQFLALPPVGYDDVPSFTSDADLGHALYEPIHINNLNISGSCKIHEYLSAGLPVLLSDRPSLRTLLTRYGCGIAADDAAPEAVASAINQFFCSNGDARKMGLAATEAFQTTFRFDYQFKPVIDALEQFAQ